MADIHDANYDEVAANLAGTDLAALLRRLLQDALQELIETDFATVIGARPHERTETRTNLRNGHRRRVLSTPAGDLELAIPKTRRGSYFPELLEPRRRVD